MTYSSFTRTTAAYCPLRVSLLLRIISVTASNTVDSTATTMPIIMNFFCTEEKASLRSARKNTLILILCAKQLNDYGKIFHCHSNPGRLNQYFCHCWIIVLVTLWTGMHV